MDKQTFPSIEKLAAYFDCNLPENEMLQISKQAEENDFLHQLMDDYSQIEDTEASYLEQNIELPDDIVGEDFKMPNINNPEKNPIVDDSFWNDEGLYNQEGINAGELDQIPETLKNTNDMETNYRTYGESGENLLDSYFKQPDGHSCGLESQRIILRDYGIDIPFDDLEQIAKETGLYSDQGTRTIDLGEVLNLAGVGIHKMHGANIYDLINEFAQGHRVIVSLDANELWRNNTMSEKMSNWLHDVFDGQGGNHALIVAGVEVNPNNTNDIRIVLTDPGAGHLRIEYPFNQFADAWKDSNCFMVATNEAAPYQYDSETNMYIPSNFYSEYYFNDFITQHGYQLNPSNIADHSMSYQPVYHGHIDMLDDTKYEGYLSQFNNGNSDHTALREGLYDHTKTVMSYEMTGSQETSPTIGFNNNSKEKIYGRLDDNLICGDTECAGSVGILNQEECYKNVDINSIHLGEGVESIGSVGIRAYGEDNISGDGTCKSDNCDSSGSVGDNLYCDESGMTSSGQ